MPALVLTKSTTVNNLRIYTNLSIRMKINLLLWRSIILFFSNISACPSRQVSWKSTCPAGVEIFTVQIVFWLNHSHNSPLSRPLLCSFTFKRTSQCHFNLPLVVTNPLSFYPICPYDTFWSLCLFILISSSAFTVSTLHKHCGLL